MIFEKVANKYMSLPSAQNRLEHKYVSEFGARGCGT